MTTQTGPVWAYLCGTRLAIAQGDELATNQRAMRIYDAMRAAIYDHPVAKKTVSFQVEWTYRQIKISIYAAGLPNELIYEIRKLTSTIIAETK